MEPEIDELEGLYRERFARFVGALGVVVGDTQVAEECVQLAFVRAVSQRSTFRGGSVAAWVWRIAVNAAIDSRRRALKLSPAGESAWDALHDLDAPELPHEGTAVVRDALMQLSPRRRLVVFLRYYGDLSQREIADVLGTSEGTIAATLSKSRALLRQLLDHTEIGGAQ